jgi:aspartate racemase
MNRVGLIGGIGPESTIEYYRLIIKKFQEKLNTKNYPELLILSINMEEMIGYAFNNKTEELIDFLSKRISILEKSEVDYIALASNTPHIVFDDLAKKTNTRMISIVEETCKAVKNKRINKIGLFGTKSTMNHGFYQLIAEKYGIEIITPSKEKQNYIHDRYINELVQNKIIPETKKELQNIAEELQKENGIEGLILGGTELCLTLSQSDFNTLTIFDTTEIHVGSIVDAMIKR